MSDNGALATVMADQNQSTALPQADAASLPLPPRPMLGDNPTDNVDSGPRPSLHTVIESGLSRSETSAMSKPVEPNKVSAVEKFGIELDTEMMRDAIHAEHGYLWDFAKEDKSGAVLMGIDAYIKDQLTAYSRHPKSFIAQNGLLLVVNDKGVCYQIPTSALAQMSKPVNQTSSTSSSPDELAKQLVAEALRIQASSFSLDQTLSELKANGYSELHMPIHAKFIDDNGKEEVERLPRLLRERIVDHAVAAVLKTSSGY